MTRQEAEAQIMEHFKEIIKWLFISNQRPRRRQAP